MQAKHESETENRKNEKTKKRKKNVKTSTILLTTPIKWSSFICMPIYVHSYECVCAFMLVAFRCESN